MSNKKQVRQQRRRKEKEEAKRKRFNPALLFIVLIVGAIVAFVAYGYFFGTEDRSPPWPGAVWSPEHGHWH